MFSLFLGELNKEIEVGLLSSSRFLAQFVTFDPQSRCHHSPALYSSVELTHELIMVLQEREETLGSQVRNSQTQRSLWEASGNRRLKIHTGFFK